MSRRGDRLGHRRSERGSAAVLGVSLVGLLLVFSMACAGIAGIVVAHRRAQSAADLGSLAAATAIQQGRRPCPGAAGVVRRNDARLLSCAVSDQSVTVQVEVEVVLLGVVRVTRAVARAGPVYDGAAGLQPR